MATRRTEAAALRCTALPLLRGGPGAAGGRPLVVRQQDELRRLLGVQVARRLGGGAVAVVPAAAVALVPRREGPCTGRGTVLAAASGGGRGEVAGGDSRGFKASAACPCRRASSSARLMRQTPGRALPGTAPRLPARPAPWLLLWRDSNGGPMIAGAGPRGRLSPCLRAVLLRLPWARSERASVRLLALLIVHEGLRRQARQPLQATRLGAPPPCPCCRCRQAAGHCAEAALHAGLQPHTRYRWRLSARDALQPRRIHAAAAVRCAIGRLPVWLAGG